jgi:LuxR family maltose regulon positive regulatory protein
MDEFRPTAGEAMQPADDIRIAAEVSRAGSLLSDRPFLDRPFVFHPGLFASIDGRRSAGSALWIAARAGAGKTALVRAYAETRGVPLVPCRPGSPDADPESILEAVARACPVSVPDVAVPKVRRRLGAVLARLPGPSILFFDDLHEFPQDAFAVTLVRDIIDAAPAGVTVMVASRRLPPPAFSRLRVSNRLAVVDDASLRLDATDAEALLRREGVRTYAEVSRMLGLADGWAAGLLLLARASRPGEAVPDLAIDYVTTEVLDALPPESRQLLARTALLPVVTESAALALTGDPAASQRLQALSRDSGFVRASGAPSGTYEVHPLVRAALNAGSARGGALSPEALAMHVSAARLLADAGQVEPAVALLVAARDWHGLTELVHRHADALVADGRGEVLSGWLGALPPSCVAAEPWLTLRLGLCHRESDPRGAAIHFEKAWQGFGRVGASDGALLACCGVVEALASSHAGFGVLDLWLDRLAPRLSAVTDAALPPAMEHLLHGGLTILSRYRPDHASLVPLTERAWRLLEAPGHPATRLAAGCFVLGRCMLHGDVRAQSRVRFLAEGLASASGAPPRLRMMWCALEVLHLCTVVDFAAARHAVERLRSMVETAGPGPWVTDLAWCSACLAAGTGDPLLAQHAVASMSDGRCDADASYHRRGVVVRAVAALLRGDAEAARNHIEAGIDVPDQRHAPAARVALLQLAAITFAKCAAHERAASCLAAAERIASGRRLGALTQSGAFVRAFVSLLAGDVAAADGALRTGIRLARAHGCPNWGLLLTPAITSRLAGVALASGIEPAWVREIIRSRSLLPEGPLSEAWPWPIRIHALGRFSVLCRDQEVRFSGRSQRKPMELLETLLALGGREVAAARVASALWPQSDGDSAANALGTTLHRLRKLLGEDACITLVDGRLTLDPRLVWVDTWAFERAASECESLVAGSASPDAIVQAFEAVIRRYVGHFLPANESGPGVLARRERLHGRFRRVSEAVAEVAVARSDGFRADIFCQRLLDIDPLAEPIHRALMRWLAAQGRHGEALETCARAERLLSAELGRGVSPATVALRRKIGDAAANAGL